MKGLFLASLLLLVVADSCFAVFTGSISTQGGSSCKWSEKALVIKEICEHWPLTANAEMIREKPFNTPANILVIHTSAPCFLSKADQNGSSTIWHIISEVMMKLARSRMQWFTEVFVVQPSPMHVMCRS